MLNGGCLCGAIRYEAGAGAMHQSACHCSMCRRAAGAPFVAWFSVPRANLRWLQGRPVAYASSEHGTRSFCARCGTQLMFEDDRSPDEIDLTTCSLDEPDRLAPQSHIYTATQVAWVKLDDGLPRFSASSRSD